MDQFGNKSFHSLLSILLIIYFLFVYNFDNYKSSNLAFAQGENDVSYRTIVKKNEFSNSSLDNTETISNDEKTLLEGEIEKERLIVIGDIHGDLDQTTTILQLAGLIALEKNSTDKKNDSTMFSWIGKRNTHLVQLGDLVDRGPDDKEVVDLFMRLQKEAEKSGGSITFILGNHELMNLIGDLRYVHRDGFISYSKGDNQAESDNQDYLKKAKLDRMKAWSAKGTHGRWIRDNFKLLHIHNRSLFVHAGLSPEYASYGAKKLNEIFKKALSLDDWKNPLFDDSGPVWSRTQVVNAKKGRCDEIEEVLDVLQVDRIIVGHTPERDLRIGSYCKGKFITVDVGISRNMYGGLAALEITTNPKTKEKELIEIVPNDIDERTELVLDDLDKQGGADVSMLQEMLGAIHEKNTVLDKKNKKNKKRYGEKKNEKNRRKKLRESKDFLSLNDEL